MLKDEEAFSGQRGRWREEYIREVRNAWMRREQCSAAGSGEGTVLETQPGRGTGGRRLGSGVPLPCQLVPPSSLPVPPTLLVTPTTQCFPRAAPGCCPLCFLMPYWLLPGRLVDRHWVLWALPGPVCCPPTAYSPPLCSSFSDPPAPTPGPGSDLPQALPTRLPSSSVSFCPWLFPF